MLIRLGLSLTRREASRSFKGDKEYLGSLAKSSGESVDVKHAEQRFGYIRQGIMYSEDTALEGLDGDPKPGESPIQGWSIGNTWGIGILDGREYPVIVRRKK
jgi:hypothetical protein